MSPRSQEQFASMRRQSRERILATALELFSTNGYHTTSVEAIAKAADVSKGLIYNYFNSKDQLLEALVVGTMEQIMAAFTPLPDEPDPRVQMRRFVDGMLDMLRRDPHFWRLYWSLLVQPSLPDAMRGKFIGYIHDAVGMLSAVFERFGSADPLAEAWAFGAMLDGVALYYTFDPQRVPVERIKECIYARYLPADNQLEPR